LSRKTIKIFDFYTSSVFQRDFTAPLITQLITVRRKHGLAYRASLPEQVVCVSCPGKRILRLSYWEALGILNSIGILTFETIPGLNRHFRNALTADLSNVESPVLCSIEAVVTRPLAGSTDTRQTPTPVTLSVRSLAGYLGRGVNVAKGFAEAYDVISELLASCGALRGAIFLRFGSDGGGGVASSTGSCAISTDGPEVAGC
jgi:hypothetical protein